MFWTHYIIDVQCRGKRQMEEGPQNQGVSTLETRKSQWDARAVQVAETCTDGRSFGRLQR